MRTLVSPSQQKIIRVTMPQGASGLRPNSLFLLILLITVVSCCGSSVIAQTTAPSTSTSAIESQAVPRVRAANAETDEKGINWTRLTLAMVVVLGLIVGLKYVAVWLFPGVRAGVTGRGVRVLARTAIAPRQQVLLLHVGRRILVVGDSAGTLNSLANIDEPDEVAELLGQISSTTTATASSKFRAMFGRAERDYDPPPESLTAADDLSNPQREQPPVEMNITAAQNELTGLLERMRNLSKQVKK